MNALSTKSCTACQIEAPSVSPEKLMELSQQIPDWTLVEVDGERRLKRTFPFADFASALKFTDQTGTLAEKHNHHPALLTEWGKVTVIWWTHKIRGLHMNDFIMAAKTDQLYSVQQQKDAGK